jgi:ABC-type phosphate transport system substrate-binding protein
MNNYHSICCLRYFLCSFMLVLSLPVFSDVAVVVHPSNVSSFSDKDLKKIFLAKKKKFPAGGRIIVLRQKKGTPVKLQFVQGLLNKSENQLKAYWSRLIFTGKALPPKEIDGDTEMKKRVSANPSVIGYIDAASVDDSVKVVKIF